MYFFNVEKRLQLLFYCQKTISVSFGIQIGVFGRSGTLSPRTSKASLVARAVSAITLQPLVLAC